MTLGDLLGFSEPTAAFWIAGNVNPWKGLYQESGKLALSVGKTPRMVPGERGRRGQAGMPAHISSKMSNPLWQPEPDLPEGRRCWQGSHLRCACQGGGSGGVRPPGRRPVGQIRALDGWGAGRPPAQPALPPQRLRGCGARAGQAFLLASSGGCQACPNCAPGCLNFASPR